MFPGKKVTGLSAVRTLPEAIVYVLGTRPGIAWRADTIMAQIQTMGWDPKGPTPKIVRITSTLSKLVAKGEARRPSRGWFQAPKPAKTRSAH